LFWSSVLGIVSSKLFAWTGFETWSSYLCLLSKIAGLSHWRLVYLYIFLEEKREKILTFSWNVCDAVGDMTYICEYMPNLKYYVQQNDFIIYKVIPKWIKKKIQEWNVLNDLISGKNYIKIKTHCTSCLSFFAFSQMWWIFFVCNKGIYRPGAYGLQRGQNLFHFKFQF
jgi:hypothetical protein